MNIQEIRQKINFKQPKYAIPALIYIPLLFTGYFVIDMFNTKVGDVPNKELQSTEYLNPELPGAKIKNDDIDGKYESMLKSYGKIDDYSAVDNIERNGYKDETEDYESKYSDADIAKVDESQQIQATEKLKEMQQKAEEQARKSKNLNKQTYRPSSSEQRQQKAMEDLQKVIAQARLNGQKSNMPTNYDTGDDDYQQRQPKINRGSNDEEEDDDNDNNSSKSSNARHQSGGNKTKSITMSKGKTGNIDATEKKQSNAVKSISEDQETEEVVKKVQTTSDYFNTITKNEPEQKLIKAIIDENVKASDGSRVRLRLLDDIVINEVVVPKGSYLYATMSGFGGQRVKGDIKSILVGDELIKVSLSIYDTDGLEGLYIPKSNFRDTSKDVASGAMSGNSNTSTTSSGSSLTQWGMQAISNAYSKTTSAISKAIKKNNAKLKYGTFVYLVNSKESKNK